MDKKTENEAYLDAMDICGCEFPRVQPQEIRMDAPGQKNWEERFDGWYVPLCYICSRARTANPTQSLERCQKYCDDLNKMTPEGFGKTTTSSSVVFLSWDKEDKSKAIDLENRLDELGVKVETVISERETGKTLPQLIEDKLKKSQIAVIICSREYLKNKGWANIERNAILNLVAHGKMTVIPVLHEITVQELTNNAPILASKIYIECPSGSFEAEFAAKKNQRSSTKVLRIKYLKFDAF